MQLPHQVDRRARAQHGLITLRQLEALGVDPEGVKRLARAGVVERVEREVYRCLGSEPSWRQRVLAACLSIGSDAAASHRAAARLWGVDLPAEAPVEVTVPRARSPRPRSAVLHRSLDLTPDWVTMRQGVPVTRPYRLLVDLGAVAPAWQVARALDVLNARKLVTIRGAAAAREALGKRGRRGVGVLGRVLDQRALGSRNAQSVLEVALAELLARAGLPSPTYQHAVVAGGTVRFVDFAYPDQMIAIEVDGWTFHSSVDRFEDDRLRGNELLLLGWQILHFTWSQVRTDPARVVRTIRQALLGGSRGPIRP